MSKSISKKMKKEWLLKMHTARAFEEMAEQLYAMGKIHGTMHLSMGMEASAVGTLAAIRDDDLVLGTHRGHSQIIAWGADVNRMMAEFLGKATGYCGGRGGSMHIADPENGFLGAQGIIGANPPIAMGVGLGLKYKKSDQVVICFMGDGTTNEGGFHEGLNMAAIWDLPVVFVIENNQYGMSMPIEKVSMTKFLSERAVSYGMPGKSVDGQDIMAVYEAAKEAIEHARSGKGPYLLENITYRYRGHSKSDANVYRTKDEIDSWMSDEKDPIALWKKILLEEKVITKSEAEEIEEKAYEIIDGAVEFADNSPEPSLDTIEKGVYTE